MCMISSRSETSMPKLNIANNGDNSNVLALPICASGIGGCEGAV